MATEGTRRRPPQQSWLRELSRPKWPRRSEPSKGPLGCARLHDLRSGRTAPLLEAARFHPVATDFHIAPPARVVLARVEEEPAACICRAATHARQIGRHDDFRDGRGESPDGQARLILVAAPGPNESRARGICWLRMWRAPILSASPLALPLPNSIQKELFQHTNILLRGLLSVLAAVQRRRGRGAGGGGGARGGRRGGGGD